MKVHFNHDYHDYYLLLFGLAAMAFGVARLLELGTDFAVGSSAIIMFLGAAAAVTGIMHYWRHK